MPPPILLILRLAETPGPCCLCSATAHGVAFVLFDQAAADAMPTRHGLSICPACAAFHGYHQAVLLALAGEEALLVAAEAEDAAGGLVDADALQAARSQLRHLVASGRLSTPPPIPVGCFDSAPSEKSAEVRFLRKRLRHWGRPVEGTAR